MADTKHGGGDLPMEIPSPPLDEKNPGEEVAPMIDAGDKKQEIEMASTQKSDKKKKDKKKKDKKKTKKAKKKKGKKNKKKDREKLRGEAEALMNRGMNREDSKDEDDLDQQKLRNYLIEDRAQEKQDKQLNKKTATFRFRISNIRLKLIGKKAGLPPVFIEFEIGGLSRDVKSAGQTEKKVEKKSASGEKTKVSVPVTKTETQILIPNSERYYTRLMKVEGNDDTDEVVIKFPEQEVEGLWTGTYDSLDREDVNIRVWHTTPAWQPNRLIGYHNLPMKKVATTTIDREEIIYRWRENTAVARKERLAMINFKFELEEIFDFEIKLSKWKVELEDEQGLDTDTCNCCANSVKRPPLVLGFEMDNTGKCCGPCTKFFGCLMLHYHCIPLKDFRCCNWINCMDCVGQPCPWLNINTHVITERPPNQMYYLSNAEKESLHRNGEQTLFYHGTRSMLEDENIRIWLWKGACCLGMCQGFANCCWSTPCCCCFHGALLNDGGEKIKENLQGKLDYGYLILYDTQLTRSSLGCLCRSCDWWCNERNVTTAPTIKGVIQTVKEPRYRQLGNVGRPTGGNKWFRFEQNTLYLCIKIVRAKSLVSLGEYKESLNPSVSVDWAQIRREIDPKEDNPDPYWNETVYFKVDVKQSALKNANLSVDDLKNWTDSKVVINVWDSTGFSKSPLGYCLVDFLTIFNNRKPKMIESTFGRPGMVSRYVYQTKQKLLSPHIDVGGTNVSGEAQSNERHIEIMAYFEKGNGSRVGPPRKPRDGKKAAKQVQLQNKKFNRDPGVTKENLKRAREFWIQALDSVPGFENRTFAFCGIDEYSGEIYYLPTFLSVMVPPAEIKSESALLYYVYSIELVLRKASGNYLQAKERQKQLEADAPGLRIWSDPWYFLDKRRGDHRDHAILLCNFLLGRKQKAFVCVGRVATKLGEQEHVWVMTMEDPEEENNAETFYKTIRFWETSNGMTYVRMNRRIKYKAAKPMETEELDDGQYIEHNLSLEAKLNEEDSDQNIEDYDVYHSHKVSSIAAQRERKRYQYQLRERVKVEEDYESQEAWERKQEKNNDLDGESETPYSGIDVIFNNENVWANLQQPHPEKISYDVHNELAWRSFKGREAKGEGYISRRDDGEKYFAKIVLPQKSKAKDNFLEKQVKNAVRKATGTDGKDKRPLYKLEVKQFYPDKTMVGTKAQEQVVDVKEKALIGVIEGAIRGYREFRSERTKFMPKFPFQETLQGRDDTAGIYIKKRLLEEAKYGNRDEKLVNKEIRKWQLENKPAIGAAKADAEEVDSLGGFRDVGLIREVWRRDITSSLAVNKKYDEVMFFFKHSDSSRISDWICTQMSKKFIQIPSSLKPEFAVGVHIHRLPGYVSPCRVLISVIYNEEHR